jgi:hypothetical protein
LFFEQDSDWIIAKSNLLKSLIMKGSATSNSIHFSLLDLILPISNLSVADAQKGVEIWFWAGTDIYLFLLTSADNLGPQVVPLLLQLITDKLPKTPAFQSLIRGRQEAARVWCFFFYKNNNNKDNTKIKTW